MEIGLRNTRILTLDELLVSMANASLTKMEPVNQSALSSETRISVPIEVAYGLNLDDVEKALLEIIRSNQHAAPDLDATVRFDLFGDSSLKFALSLLVVRPNIKKKSLSPR